MPAESSQSRLDRISTQWSLVFEAHCRSEERAQPARAKLALRYRGAVYRYLVSLVRDPDLAEELCQQFAVVFLEGKFHRADPQQGRFRDYVKAAVVNLVRRHYAERTKAPGPLPRELAETAVFPTAVFPTEAFDDQTEFLREWREEVLNQTWHALQQQRRVYHDVLRLRVDHPDLTSREIADRYSSQRSKPMQAANVRKTLERAHVKFADLLVREVAGLLEQPDVARVRRELEELDLFKYCRTALDRWSAASRKATRSD